MNVPFYDIQAQYAEFHEEFDSAAVEVLASGAYIMGPHHQALEKEIAELHGCRFGIGVNSGTDAIRIMLDAAEVGREDEVITTAFTFVASAETVVQTGAKPVFVDIDPDTFNIDSRQIPSAVTANTKAIMPIHLFGQMADVVQISELATKHELLLLEDAAQAIGNTHNGVPAGKFGKAAALSFYVTKNLGAAGDAGMILTDDEEFASRCRALRVHGMLRERYYYDFVGYTSRLDEIQAAVLRIKLRALEEWNRRRSKIAALYQDALRGLDLKLPIVSTGNNHTWHQFSIQTPRRDTLQEFLKSRGIASMIYYPVPLHFHEPYRKYGDGPGSLPITERVCQEVLSLPCHPHLSLGHAEFVALAIREFFGC